MDLLVLIVASIALLAVVACASVLHVKSDSMEPALCANDRLLAVRYWKSKPRLGDIVVLKFQQNPRSSDGSNRRSGSRLVVKRVFAVAGDMVNVPAEMEKVHGDGLPANNGKLASSARSGRPLLIPADSVYVVGDHSLVSYDSRHYGPVRTEVVVGVAKAILWPPRRVRCLRRSPFRNIQRDAA
jgi:signal peptidase I